VAGDEGERRQVEARGGEVPEASPGEKRRVNGLLEITRALGDRSLKPAVSREAEVHHRELSEADQLLVMGSDGLSDVLQQGNVVRALSATLLTSAPCGCGNHACAPQSFVCLALSRYCASPHGTGAGKGCAPAHAAWRQGTCLRAGQAGLS
jgi:serine/threonine protein phosphatase PrpC